MASTLEELLMFLAPCARNDVKVLSLDYLLGITGTDDGKQLLTQNLNIIDALITLTDDKSNNIQEHSYSTLINLSTIQTVISHVIAKEEFIKKLLRNILEKDYKFTNQVCMLISNLSRSFHDNNIIFNYIIQVYTTKDILTQFVNILCNSSYNQLGNYHYLAYLLSNLSQIKDVCDTLIKEGLLKKLLSFVSYKDSVIRRRGVISLLRNCCFHTDLHEALLSADIDILPTLLLPLAGPEQFDDDDMERLPIDLQYLEPDKSREPDAENRTLLVEAINQLCATKFGRHYIREKNAYVILRELHKWESDRRTSIAIHNVIDILIGDEPAEEHENLRNINIPDELGAQFDKEDTEFLDEVQ